MTITSMGHPEDHELGKYALGTLGEAERPAISEHLTACPLCSGVVMQLEARALAATRTHGPAPVAEPVPTRKLHRGLSVGRYLVIDSIGVGGMGEVYAAYDPQLDRRVALKVLLHQDEIGAAQTRMLREAQALARLQHPNVVGIHDVGVNDDGSIFLAMELVQGQSLRQWLKGERGWGQIVRAFIAAGRGLAAAHDAGLVHRDFKPENVLVGDDQRVRVVDFGLAQEGEGTAPIATGGGTPTVNALAAQVTQEGAVPGTLAYMSPDQLLGLGASPKSDQFSFCVSLFEALNGGRPFVSATFGGLFEAFTRGPAPATQTRRGPAWLHAAIARGLAFDPAARWPDLPSLLEALEGPSQQRRLLPAVVIGAVLAAAIASVAAVSRHRASACESAALQGGQTWAASRSAVAAAFASTNLPYAGEALGRVEASLDSWVASWAAAKRGLCSSAAQDRGASDRCLDDRLEELKATLEVFQAADPDVVASAPMAAHALEPPINCVDPAFSPTLLSSTTGPALERQVLRTATALIRSGKYGEARKQLGTLLQGASSQRAQAEARLQEIVAARRAGEKEEALRPLIVDAMRAAIEAREPGLLARALSVRSVSAANLKEPPGDWAALARAAAHAQGDDPVLGLALEDDEAVVALMRKDWVDAEARLQRLLTHQERRYGPNHPDVLGARANLAIALARLDKRDEALALTIVVVEASRLTNGPSHPATASRLHNLAVLLRVSGRASDARKAAAEAVALRAALGGSSGRLTQQSRLVLAFALRAEGEPVRALEVVTSLMAEPDPAALGSLLHTVRFSLELELGHLDEAEAELAKLRVAMASEKTPGPSDEADLLAYLGELQSARRDWSAASKSLLKALVLYEARKDEAGAASVESDLGALSEAQGRWEPALTRYQHALALKEKTRPDGVDCALALEAMGRVLRAAGRPHEAIAPLERGLALRAHIQNPRALAHLQLELARALAAEGNGVRVTALVKTALPALEGKDLAAAQALLRAD